ncbi:hypothetical protein HID58_057593, partial [Brassica napus]
MHIFHYKTVRGKEHESQKFAPSVHRHQQLSAAGGGFSSPTLFALGSFSGLEAFSRPDLLADEAETCGEEMKLNGEVELQVFLWFFPAQLPRFPFQASRSVGGSELRSLLLRAVRLVETVSKESGKDEDENQMMRNGESVFLQPIQQTPDGTSHGSQVDLYEIPYPAAGVYCRSTVWFSSNYLPLRRTLERIEENRRRADNRKQARRTDHSQGNQGYYNERPENRNHHYDGRREHLPDRSFSANENRERHRTRSREPTYRLPPIRESSDVSLRSRGMHSANPPVKNVWRPVSRDRENGGHSNSVQSQVSHTPSPLPPRERITSPNITPQGTPRPAGEKSATPSARRSALERLRSALARISTPPTRVPLLHNRVANSESGRLHEVDIQYLEEMFPYQTPEAPSTRMTLRGTGKKKIAKTPAKKRTIRSPVQGISLNKRRVTKAQSSPK